MAYYGANRDDLQNIAMRLHAIERDIDSITTGVRSIAADVSRNPSLNKLGYARMIRSASDSTEKHAKKTGQFSNTLEKVAELYDTYENRVITSPLYPSNDPGTSDTGTHDTETSKNPFWSFLVEGFELDWPLLRGDLLSGEGKLLGISASGAVAGELLGGSWSFSPDVKFDIADGEFHAGVKGEGEFHVAQLTAEGDLGLLHGDAEISAGRLAAEGELGASLYRDGKFDPSLRAKLEGRASALHGEADGRFGTEDTNLHVAAEGDLFTASGELTGYIGKDGVEAKIEAGAYCAEGEISGGFNFFGIQVDVGLEGKAGGAGIEAGFTAGDASLSGELGAGLGLGAGVKFSIDFSGVPQAIDNTVQWWNSLWQ